MVNPLPTPGTELAPLKGWSSHIKNEAVVVVGMSAVNPFHVGSCLLVVHRFRRVIWKQSLSAYLPTQSFQFKYLGPRLALIEAHLTRLNRISLYTGN